MLQSFNKFRSDEDGAATMEAVLWLPFFILLFVMILDATMIFSNHSRVMRIVHDGNRAYALGNITGCAELEEWLEARVTPLAASASATCVRDEGVATATVTMNSDDLDLSGATGIFGGLTVAARSQHIIEPGA